MTIDDDPAFRSVFIIGPDRPWWTPARLLRRLAGVDERLIRIVWAERARHTSLGGLILGSGLLAGVSMLMAISEPPGQITVWSAAAALTWAVAVTALQRVLVATGPRRWLRSALGLLLGTLAGVTLAEPLARTGDGWVVRLVVVFVYLAPMITNFSAGPSAYDRLAGARPFKHLDLGRHDDDDD